MIFFILRRFEDWKKKKKNRQVTGKRILISTHSLLDCFETPFYSVYETYVPS